MPFPKVARKRKKFAVSLGLGSCGIDICDSLADDDMGIVQNRIAMRRQEVFERQHQNPFKIRHIRMEARAPGGADVARTEKAALFHYFSRSCVEILVGAGHVLETVAGNQDATAALEE